MLKTQEPKMLREIITPETVDIDYEKDILEQLSKQIIEFRIINQEVRPPKKSNEKLTMCLEKILTAGLVAMACVMYYSTPSNQFEQGNKTEQTPTNVHNIHNLRSNYSEIVRHF
jgi:hypothetical protein